MLQNKQSEAFLAVIETGSFELAAEKLYLTASAVTLRIQSLEKALGHILIIRERPCRTTPAGQKLLEHLQHTRLIQESFLQDLQGQSQQSSFYKVRIGSNADSLATWLLPAVQQCLIEQQIMLEVKVEDQSQTHQLLETGLVNACISTESQPMKGCVAQALGCMRYKLVATPIFQARYFPRGIDRSSLMQAPAVIFNHQDHLHADLLLKHFGLNNTVYPQHFIPSSTAFLQMISLGLGYGLVPLIQMQDQLKQGQLLELAVDHPVDVMLYWHHWKRQSAPLEKLSQALLVQSQRYLALY